MDRDPAYAPERAWPQWAMLALVAAFASYVIWDVVGFNQRTALYPMVAGGAILAFLAPLALSMAMGARPGDDVLRRGSASPSEARATRRPAEFWLAVILGHLGLCALAGFVLGTAAFIIAFLMIFGRVRLWQASLGAAGFVLLLGRALRATDPEIPRRAPPDPRRGRPALAPAMNGGPMIQTRTLLSDPDSPDARLARHIATSPCRALPPEVTRKARLHLLDTLSAILSGRALAAGEFGYRFAELHGGAGPATLLGDRRRVGAEMAAFANAMAAHADETDDSHVRGPVPPTAAAWSRRPWPWPRAKGRSGADLLGAIALGYDVGARATMALGFANPRTTTFSTHAFRRAVRCRRRGRGPWLRWTRRSLNRCCPSPSSRRRACPTGTATRITSRNPSTSARAPRATVCSPLSWPTPE